jgi:hypothetical protein
MSFKFIVTVILIAIFFTILKTKLSNVKLIIQYLKFRVKYYKYFFITVLGLFYFFYEDYFLYIIIPYSIFFVFDFILKLLVFSNKKTRKLSRFFQYL